MTADSSRTVGVAFQVLNDFKDWTGDEDNKLVAGQDVLAARPTLFLALALESAAPADKAELMRLLHKGGTSTEEHVEKVRGIYHRAKVFARADGLVDKFRAKA